MGESLASATMLALGAVGGGTVDGRAYSKGDCYAQAAELDPSNAEAFKRLAIAGGGTIHGRAYSRADCFARTVELDPSDTVLVNNLGLAGGGTICGRAYSKADCFVRAIEMDPSNAAFFYNLGTEGGGTIRGRAYSKVECFVRAIELDPCHDAAFFKLGAEGGGTIRGRAYSPADCYVRGIELDPSNAVAFNNLGKQGGGTICGRAYSPADCFVQAIELDPSNAKFFYNLGTRGGGTIRGRAYSKAECLVRTIDLDPSNAAAFVSLGAAGGGTIRGRAYSPVDCYARAAELDPACSTSWHALGNSGGGAVNGRVYTEAECHLRAIELEPSCRFPSSGIEVGETIQGRSRRQAEAYVQAGMFLRLAKMGGGTVDGQPYSETECFIRAMDFDAGYLGAAECGTNHSIPFHELCTGRSASRDGHRCIGAACYVRAIELDPDDTMAVYLLGKMGGGIVNGRTYTPAECHTLVTNAYQGVDPFVASAEPPTAMFECAYFSCVALLLLRTAVAVSSDVDRAQGADLRRLLSYATRRFREAFLRCVGRESEDEEDENSGSNQVALTDARSYRNENIVSAFARTFVLMQVASSAPVQGMGHVLGSVVSRLGSDRLFAAGWDDPRDYVSGPLRRAVVERRALRFVAESADAMFLLQRCPGSRSDVAVFQLCPRQRRGPPGGPSRTPWYSELYGLLDKLTARGRKEGWAVRLRQCEVAKRWLEALPYVYGSEQDAEGLPRGAIMLLDTWSLAVQAAVWEWKHGPCWGHGRGRGLRARSVAVHAEDLAFWLPTFAEAGFRVERRHGVEQIRRVGNAVWDLGEVLLGDVLQRSYDVLLRGPFIDGFPTESEEAAPRRARSCPPALSAAISQARPGASVAEALVSEEQRIQTSGR